MRRLFDRLIIFAIACLVMGGLARAADMSLSTGEHFEPTGQAMFLGADLNVMVDRVNGLSDGTVPLSGAFNGTVGATTPSTGAFTSTTATTSVGLPASSACSGTTTATCQGQRNVVSITGLTTAAGGAASAAMTVTNASSVAATTTIMCRVNGYAGTGNPVANKVIPGDGSYSFVITNILTAAGAALNATVPVACILLN